MTIDHLNIFKNKVKGKGTDEVGEYTISGELKPDNTVTFVKQYIGKHSVNYEGTFDLIKFEFVESGIYPLKTRVIHQISKNYAYWNGWD